MKTNLPLLLAALLLLAGCASSSTERPVARHTLEAKLPLIVDLPPRAGEDPAEPAVDYWSTNVAVKGMDKPGVLRVLGSPGERVNANLWVYWQYYSPEKAAEIAAGHDTLVVAFADDKVSEMKLVNGALLRKHLSGKRQRAPLNEI